MNESYTRTAISLHWIIAILIFAGWGLGLYMHELPASPMKLRYFSWHKWIGVSVFLLAIVRAAWLAAHPTPALPRAMPPMQQRLAHLSHGLLYFLMFAVPVSGWLMSSAKGVQTVYFGIVPLPDLVPKNKELGHTLKEVHEFLAYSLAVLVALHAAAALKHHFIDRDNVLTRMLPGTRRSDRGS